MSFVLFPGQGSQQPGMGQDFYEGSPPAREALDDAAAVLGPEFLPTLFDGSEDQLKDTRNAQVALVAVGVAIVRHLSAAGIEPSGTAGHSVGEIGALVAAGSVAFPDALRLTRERARLMAEEAPPGTMAAVLGLDSETIAAALPEGAEIANYNGPDQTIISGTVEGIEAAMPALKEAGAKRVMPLPVSGAFHSSLMRKPAEGLRAFLEDVVFQSPRCRFVSSVSARDESDPGRIRDLLWRQLYSPVRWSETMAAIGPVQAIEAGPKTVLQGLARRMDNGPEVRPAGTLDAADALVAV